MIHCSLKLETWFVLKPAETKLFSWVFSLILLRSLRYEDVSFRSQKMKDWWAYCNSSLDMQSNQPRPAAAVGFEGISVERYTATYSPSPGFFHKPLGL